MSIRFKTFLGLGAVSKDMNMEPLEKLSSLGWMPRSGRIGWKTCMVWRKATYQQSSSLIIRSIWFFPVLRSSDLLIFVSSQELNYYDVDRHGRKFKLETNNVLAAVDDVLSKKLRSKSSENIAERYARVCHSYLFWIVSMELIIFQRLNNAIIGLERFVVAHPYLSIATGLVFLVGFVLLIKKFIEDDSMSSYGHDYTKIRKHGSRLD